jgi:hypothetical protein
MLYLFIFWSDKALGKTCNEDTECSDPAAKCLNNKCTCNTNSYDNNGQDDGGTCMESKKKSSTLSS